MTLARGPETARIRTGKLEFRTLRRTLPDDGGPVLEVHAEWATDRWRQVLRYDCFLRTPHRHRLFADGRDERDLLATTSPHETIDFALQELAQQLCPWLREMGYPEVARSAEAMDLSIPLQQVARRLNAMLEPRGGRPL